MNLYNLSLIGLALAMDAFAVALSIGINCDVKRNNKIGFLLSFSFFQFLLSLVGALLGKFVNETILSVPSLIGGAVIVIVGILMIEEGLESKEECLLVKPKMYLILGISVSIDALVVGFTALHSSGNLIFRDTLIIGLITFIMVSLSFLLSRTLSKFPMIVKYADYLGGVILVIFGLKMIFM